MSGGGGGAGPLERLIREEIARNGPITVARYMALALGHPEHGYYRRARPLGAAGDFTTAPEISQIFGELVGLWLVDAWMRLGAPARVALVELGPGRGVLMADALRAAARVPEFLQAAQLHLVDISEPLREEQAARLSAHAPVWLEDLSAAPDLPLLLIANEFFDALPIHQFERTAVGWREQTVALADDGFRFDLAHPTPGFEARLAAAGAMRFLEINPGAEAVAAEIAARIAGAGGAALFVDYGYDRAGLTVAKERASGGDTLQAMRGHAFADPLKNPGLADLTAHVDFEALERAVRDAAPETAFWGPIGQGGFLRALGAEARAAVLARANPDRSEEIAAGLHRLTHPNEMGRLFKAAALTSTRAWAPAGFPASAPETPPRS